ncbi:hypothetical protein TYRP_021641 [Tyrophagus putrescentiae]|nr:hypothetical protein TYRP_021641 [Tyrophagus putrescentiae]
MITISSDFVSPSPSFSSAFLFSKSPAETNRFHNYTNRSDFKFRLKAFACSIVCLTPPLILQLKRVLNVQSINFKRYHSIDGID